jgi:glycosyltransferase involved in cell wall biosynthesis
MTTRLAVLTDVVAPWHTGGKEQRQQELFTRLVRRGLQVDVYTMKWWDGPRRLERDGVTYHAICPRIPLYAGQRRSILQAVVFALCTLRMVSRRYDVLEVDAIPFLQLFPARLVAWLRRVPMVVTWHEYWGRGYWTDYLGPLGRAAAFIERLAIRLPDRIVAASEGTAERLRAACPGELDVHVVTPGIDLAALPDVPVEPARDRPDELRLVYAGRLLEHKNVDVAIRALDLLRRGGTAARLSVIGQGPAAERLEALAAELDLADRVEFHAFLPEHADVLAQLAAADLLVFPTVREGFGMVALEAMSLGTPVVTSDHPDNFARHLVASPTPAGAVCPATPAAFAAAIANSRTRLAELAPAARATAAGYDWERIADRARAAYAFS